MTREEILRIAKPILFNTDMVRAILDGRKTATRRIMKPQPLFKTCRKFIFADETCPKKWEGCDDIIETYKYQPSDYLYVRETWNLLPFYKTYIYKAEKNSNHQAQDIPVGKIGHIKWKPSIHMPKEAARIFLRVTDVRVERLQDIEDFVKEGVSPGTHATAHMNYYDEKCDFVILWNSTIPKKDLDKYSWNANPWVWVIEFERVQV